MNRLIFAGVALLVSIGFHFTGCANPDTVVQERDQEMGFSFRDENGQLKIMEGEKPVLVYNYGVQSPETISAEYWRSTYIHPVWDLSGNVITDDFPEDHLHHRGISWNWPRVIVGEKEHDLWALLGIRQEFVEWLARDVTSSSATVGVKNAWVTEDRKILEEEVWFRVYPAEENSRAIDLEITLNPLERIVLSGREEKGYGGVTFRYAPRENTTITTPEGVQPEDRDHDHMPWADLSGRFGASDEMSGVALFQHKDHPDFPTSWMLRHYGMIGSAWPGTEMVTLEPGIPLTLRFRVFIHSHDAASANLAEAYEAYQNTPVLSMSE